MSPRFRLRAATSAIHERVELQMDITQRLGSIEAYKSLLEDFFSLIRPIKRSPEAVGIYRSVITIAAS